MTDRNPLGQARLGILMLETRFPRILGDIGNPDTWPFPVAFKVVRGASARRVVVDRADGLIDAFVAAAEEMVREGADGIATTCGFLALYQRELAARLSVPVATSSLMQVPLVQALLPPGKRVGVLTVNAAALTPAHLVPVCAPADTPVMGTEGGSEFTRVFLGDAPTLDVAAAAADVIAAGEALVRRHPEVGAIVLECTNMVPYAARLRAHLGRPVYDIYSFLTWFHAGLRPRDFGAV